MIELSPIQQNFIIHWGKMGEKWGINRTIAQIHGLLYLSPQALSAEEITKTLSIARSTVSVGLHELQSWGIIKVVHVLGERTDRFEIKGDVWEMFRWIIEHRKSQEVDPTLNMLRETAADLEQSQEDAHTKAKMNEMLDLFETIDSLYTQVEKIPTKTIVRFAKKRNALKRFLRPTRK